jgi:hypothetical protein
MTVEEYQLESARLHHNSYLRGYTDPVLGSSSSSSQLDTFDTGPENQITESTSKTAHQEDVQSHVPAHAESQLPDAVCQIGENFKEDIIIPKSLGCESGESTEDEILESPGIRVVTTPRSKMFGQTADGDREHREFLNLSAEKKAIHDVHLPKLNLSVTTKVEGSKTLSPSSRTIQWPPDSPIYSPKSACTPKRSGRTFSDDRAAIEARDAPSVTKWFQQMVKQREEAAEKEKAARRASCESSVLVAEKIYHIEYKVAEREAVKHLSLGDDDGMNTY